MITRQSVQSASRNEIRQEAWDMVHIIDLQGFDLTINQGVD